MLALVVSAGRGADDRSPFVGQVISIDKGWGQRPLNGHPIWVRIYNFLDVRDDDYSLTVDVDVDVPADFPLIDSAEVEVEVLDEQGGKIAVRTRMKQFERGHKSQVGVYDLRLKRGQKIWTVKVQWKGSKQVFLMSQAQTGEETISS